MNRTAIEREQRVFQQFASVAPIGIRMETIESRPMPEPDIYCDSKVLGQLAFELVELIDENYAKRTSDMARTQVMLRDLPTRLPAPLRADLKEKLGDPIIFLHFRDQIALRDREERAIAGLEWLVKQGNMDAVYDSPDEVLRGFESLSIRSWKHGLRIQCSSMGYVSDPTLDRLKAKFTKKYESRHPIELLMYTEIDLLMPDDVWRPGACLVSITKPAFLEGALHTLQFGRGLRGGGDLHLNHHRR